MAIYKSVYYYCYQLFHDLADHVLTDLARRRRWKNSCWWPVYLGYISATNLWSLAALWRVMYFRFCGWRHVCPQCKGDVRWIIDGVARSRADRRSLKYSQSEPQWTETGSFTGITSLDYWRQRSGYTDNAVHRVNDWSGYDWRLTELTDWPISSGFRHALQKM